MYEPVVYLDPQTGEPEIMPIEMLQAYVPYSEGMNLFDAARLANMRDREAANALLQSITDAVGIPPYPIDEEIINVLSVKPGMALR